MRWLRNMLWYAGTDKESYERIKRRILESNRKNLVAFLLIASIALLLMVFSSYLEPSLMKNRAVYLALCIVCIVMLVAAHGPAKTRPNLAHTIKYSFSSLLLMFGIVLGTFIEPNETTVSYTVLLFAVPLLFTDRPIRMVIISVGSIILYVICALYTQTTQMFIYNMSNIIPYGVLSLLVSTYMMYIKIARFLLEEKNGNLIETDQLTGLYNRHSYNIALEELSKTSDSDYSICVFDINGLKVVNDKYGHQAGDELICGAAQCISDVFGGYGKCYRVGGDEFIVLIKGGVINAHDLREALKERTEQWSGEYVKSVSIAVGIATADEDSNVQDVLHQSDMDMYKYKSEYYRTKDMDRRKN